MAEIKWYQSGEMPGFITPLLTGDGAHLVAFKVFWFTLDCVKQWSNSTSIFRSTGWHKNHDVNYLVC